MQKLDRVILVLHIDKNILQKFCIWTIKATFQNRAVPLRKNFSENFLSWMCRSGLSRCGQIKLRTKKCILLHGEVKTYKIEQKRWKTYTDYCTAKCTLLSSLCYESKNLMRKISTKLECAYLLLHKINKMLTTIYTSHVTVLPTLWITGYFTSV